MEEKILELQNYLSNKDQYLINITSNKSDIKYQFNPPLELSPNRNYKLGLLWFSAYNTIFNVNDTNNNFAIYDYKNSKYYQVKLDPGAYEITQINKEIQGKIKEKLPDLKTNIEITLDKSTSKSIIKIPENIGVDCNIDKSILRMLGFNKTKEYIKGIVKSDNIVQIIQISTINIDCNLVSGSYINGKKCNILYSFPSYTVPVGHKIIERISHPVYLPILKTSIISSIHIKIINEDQDLINFNGEEISMSLELKQV